MFVFFMISVKRGCVKSRWRKRMKNMSTAQTFIEKVLQEFFKLAQIMTNDSWWWSSKYDNTKLHLSWPYWDSSVETNNAQRKRLWHCFQAGESHTSGFSQSCPRCSTIPPFHLLALNPSTDKLICKGPELANPQSTTFFAYRALRG